MISAIVPIYNSGISAEKALRSIYNQNYDGNIEILLIDDGSSDGSYDYLTNLLNTQEFNKKNNREIKIFRKENGGVSSARNFGINKASFQWLAFLDSDDVWHPQKISEQIDVIRSNLHIKFLGTNRNGEKHFKSLISKNKIFLLDKYSMLLKWYPHTSTVMIRKTIFDKCGLYDENFTHAEDGDLWLNILTKEKIWVLNKNLVYTGDGKKSYGEKGLSADLNKMFQGEIKALRKFRDSKNISYIATIFFTFFLYLKYIKRVVITKVRSFSNAI